MLHRGCGAAERLHGEEARRPRWSDFITWLESVAYSASSALSVTPANFLSLSGSLLLLAAEEVS